MQYSPRRCNSFTASLKPFAASSSIICLQSQKLHSVPQLLVKFGFWKMPWKCGLSSLMHICINGTYTNATIWRIYASVVIKGILPKWWMKLYVQAPHSAWIEVRVYSVSPVFWAMMDCSPVLWVAVVRVSCCCLLVVNRCFIGSRGWLDHVTDGREYCSHV